MTMEVNRRGRGTVQGATRVNLYLSRDANEKISEFATHFGVARSLIIEILVERATLDEDFLTGFPDS